jgi:hypothetical protein
MLLLGLVVVYYFGTPGNTTSGWNVNVLWTGGYAGESKWYGDLAKGLNATTLPVVVTLLKLLFGAFAVAIKLTVVEGLQPEPQPQQNDPLF